MKKIRALIVDDEFLGRENLKGMLTNHCPSVEVIATVGSIKEASEIIRNQQPQLVFLDILMNAENGFDLLDLFPERKFMVIFVSASMDFGIRAVKAGVLDYVLKPIDSVELQKAVRKAEQTLRENSSPIFLESARQSKIALSHATGFTLEEIDNVVRLQADDNYTNVYTKSGRVYLICRPLGDFEKYLPQDVFVRVHKTHMINIRHLRDFTNEDGGIAVLNDGFKVPVSKRKSSLFIRAIRKFSLMIRS